MHGIIRSYSFSMQQLYEVSFANDRINRHWRKEKIAVVKKWNGKRIELTQIPQLITESGCDVILGRESVMVYNDYVE